MCTKKKSSKIAWMPSLVSKNKQSIQNFVTITKAKITSEENHTIFTGKLQENKYAKSIGNCIYESQNNVKN